MKAQLLGAGAAIAIACIGACFVAPGRVDGSGSSSTTGALNCAAAERAFNGACRALCSESLPCAAGSVCAGIDSKDAVCLEPSVTCSYLGDDHVCASRGGHYSYGRGTSTFMAYQSYPSYGIDPLTLTEDRDAYFTPAYGGYGVQNDGQGCQGDARWVPAPLAGSVACRARHDVKRCRLVNAYSCSLVSGTTEETVLPAP